MSSLTAPRNAVLGSTKDARFPFLALVLLLAFAVQGWGGNKTKDEDTLINATGVLQGMLSDKNISREVIRKAECIVVLPEVKRVGLVVGGSGGRGPMLCRTGAAFNGGWSAPAMYTVGSMSAGLQVGASSSDLLLLIMTEKGVNAVLNGKTKVGADVTVAVGPGATARTLSGADILSFGKSEGLFVGVSLSGASLKPDDDANKRLYGKALTPTEIVRHNQVRPPAIGGEALIWLLDAKASSK
jgi:SH3 domain-containing YSC84-like protein 1